MTKLPLRSVTKLPLFLLFEITISLSGVTVVKGLTGFSVVRGAASVLSCPRSGCENSDIIIKMEEQTYTKYYRYLESGEYPAGVNKEEKRDIRKKCEPFCVEDGYLMHKRKINNEVQLRQVLMKTEMNRVIKACHEEFGGAHMGRDKTIRKITAKYYFKASNKVLVIMFLNVTSVRERVTNPQCKLQS